MSIRSILIADDEPDIRRIVELTLRAITPWTVHLAAGGEEALRIAAAHQPDLVVLDVMMPGMDGPTTLQRLRADPRTASLPVAFMTAKAQRTEIDRFLALGAVGVVTKPFDPLELPRDLERLVPAGS